MSKERCKQRVYSRSGLSFSGSACYRNSVRDGYCTQHHPDAAAVRRAKSLERFKAECAASDLRSAVWKKNAAQVALFPELIDALQAVADADGTDVTAIQDAARIALNKVKSSMRIADAASRSAV